ncbi:hypothetical protein [Streptomyces sp. NPDC085596]|uniref:hypothetical protein n=1 Tax=Streptomyces sp. NPDC085596 TaxID=3365731 RepID=UPI0037D25525
MTREAVLALPQPLRWLFQLVWPTGLHRPHAAICGQQFVHCPDCGVDTAASVHGDLIRCAEGHIVQVIA